MGLFNIMMGKARSKLGFDIRLGIWNYEPRINAGCWNPAISNIWWPKVPAWSVPYPVPLKHHMYTIPGSFVIYALCARMVLYTNDQRFLLQRALNYTSRPPYTSEVRMYPCQHSSKCILMTFEHKLEHVGMHTEPCGHGAKMCKVKSLIMGRLCQRFHAKWQQFARSICTLWVLILYQLLLHEDVHIT